ncbi:MAG: hypothetical protein Q9195_005300 [Heterodermia aff. obscurata]
MARLVRQTEVGYASDANIGWRPKSVEHSKASEIGHANHHSRAETERQCRPWAELGCVVKKWTNTATLGWVCIWLSLWEFRGIPIDRFDRETRSWDVRTKHITYEPIPTVDRITAIANHGPTATLFTKGPDFTIRQYDLLSNPPLVVKKVQLMPMLPPPVPSKNSANTPQSGHIPGAAPPAAFPYGGEQLGGPVDLSTIQRTTNEMNAIELARQDRSGMSSPVSSRSMTESASSRSSNPYQYQRTGSILSSRAASGTTFSTISPSMVGRESLFSSGSSLFPKTSSMASSGRRSKGSRLRQEVLLSPESSYIDLFPRTRIRLSNVTYHLPQPLDQDNMSPDDLRRRMLNIVFGWEDDIEPLIRDELAYHKPGSTSAVLLSKWLGEVDSDMMAAMISSGSVNSSDWMLLALSQMGGPGSQLGKMGQAFVQRLLSQGDFHTSATILLGLGDREDAVEVYVSRSFYMEAILLTCLVFPTDWQRQAHLVRRWGEFVVENSQQQLAIRCFTCTGVEPPIPWASPSLHSQSTPSQAPTSVSSLLSPPTSPPPGLRPSNSVRMTTKNSSLKVITSFSQDKLQHGRLMGLKSDDRTPTNAPGITPIAESAMSPGGTTPASFLRPSSRSSNAGRTTTPGGFHRHRLPSIGETPVDVSVPPFSRPSALPTPNDSGSDREKEILLSQKTQQPSSQQEDPGDAPLLLSAARYEPSSAVTVKSPTTALPTSAAIQTAVMPNPPEGSFAALKEKSRTRNGSRDRKPDGLHIQMPPQSQIQTTYITHLRPGSRTDHRRSQSNSIPMSGGSLPSGRSDTRSDNKSPPPSGISWSTKSPSISGRSIDQYISSLEEAGHRSRRNKTSSRRLNRSREGKKSTGESTTRSKPKSREISTDRGRNNQRYIRPAKRSPSSPVPMSPDDLNLYRDSPSIESVEAYQASRRSSGGDSRHGRDQKSQKGVNKLRSGSKASDFSTRTVRRASPDGSEASFTEISKASSRRLSPNGLLDPNGRGRSKSKNGSAIRSPSSPLPMSPQAKYYQRSDDEDDPLRFVEANRQRLRSRHRSSSRRPQERGSSSRRDTSSDRRQVVEDRRTRLSDEGESLLPRSAVEQRVSSNEIFAMGSNQSATGREKAERSLKKELAARELEARRISLAQRVDAQQIVHPADLSTARPLMSMRSQTDLGNFPSSYTNPMSTQQQTQRYPTGPMGGDTGNGAPSAVPSYGLPATPRAMRHPRYDSKDDSRIPSVPEVPDNLEKLTETYYTGQPMQELPRSMSAPIPQETVVTGELPMHPAFHKALRPSTKGSNFSPLGDIGQHRRKPSGDASSMSQLPVTVSIDETLHAADSTVHITTIDEPPLLPELQHLSGAVPPPPPPPPPFHNDGTHHSLSSGSGVGTISIAMDDQPEHIIDVPPPPPPPHPTQTARSPALARSPPPIAMAQKSPPPTIIRSGSAQGHRRGRSDNLKNGIKGFTERLRSTSRGRNNPKSPPENSNTPSPYESVPPLYF